MPDPITTAAATKAAETIATLGVKGIWKLVKDKVWRKKSPTIEEIKKTTRILFIDDEDFSSRIQTLRDAGWGVNQVRDVTDYYSEAIKQADIIFLDYQGVGTTLSTEQGIGLLKSIKTRHPEKFLIFYSGQAGFMKGHEVYPIADDWIEKYADASVYLDHIEAAAKKLHAVQ